MRSHGVARTLVAILVVTGGGTASGNRGGATGGWNGSPASGGAANNCMSCHGSLPGSGGVTIVGAPTEYEPGVVYDLAVRIIDAQQQGAGFQISVEDAQGAHAGMLIITDQVHTQPAPGEPGWVTHTLDGVDRSVAQWSEMGNAAEYELRWKAPDVDVGPITVYAAGNAINNDFQAFNDSDRIYLAQVTAGPLTSSCSDSVQNGAETGVDCGGPCADCECAVDGECDDGDPCTDDACVGGACATMAIPDCCRNAAECDDGLFCNGAEVCVMSRCQAGVMPCPGQRCDEAVARCVECLEDVDCDDGNPCTANACEGGACATSAIPGCCRGAAECDDGLFCNGAEVCVNLQCQAGSTPCRGLLCDEAAERCVACFADGDCADGDACSTDTCVDGACIHDMIENCPPVGQPVPSDADGDGVIDEGDRCPGTAVDQTVDDVGCSCAQRDGDGDGIDECTDRCPQTPDGTLVDDGGCAAPPTSGDEAADGTGDEADDGMGDEGEPGEGELPPGDPPSQPCGALGMIVWLPSLVVCTVLRGRRGARHNRAG